MFSILITPSEYQTKEVIDFATIWITEKWARDELEMFIFFTLYSGSILGARLTDSLLVFRLQLKQCRQKQTDWIWDKGASGGVMISKLD